MGLELSLTSTTNTINLGETFTVSYSCTGAYDCTLQADNMANPIVFGTGEVAGDIKFLPVVSGVFNVYLTALGVVHQSLGIDNMSETETNVTTLFVTVN
jgi:hypothetical protein